MSQSRGVNGTVRLIGNNFNKTHCFYEDFEAVAHNIRFGRIQATKNPQAIYAGSTWIGWDSKAIPLATSLTSGSQNPGASIRIWSPG